MRKIDWAASPAAFIKVLVIDYVCVLYHIEIVPAGFDAQNITPTDCATKLHVSQTQAKQHCTFYILRNTESFRSI